MVRAALEQLDLSQDYLPEEIRLEYELAEYKDAIMAAMLKGTKRHVESMPEKNEKGNVQTGQSHQK